MDGRGILWTQFILAAAVARTARALLDRAPAATSASDSELLFSYADTHGGSGRIEPPAMLAAVLAHGRDFTTPCFHAAMTATPGHPGSWVLAGRVIGGLPRLAFEADVNDIAPEVIAAAKDNREVGWTRFWSHDWFQFLRNRIAMANRPHFVFIDPPPDDPRGPGYAIDAAILLDTLGIPYMVSYPVESPQDPIDQIGRTGLELHRDGWGCGVLLGGGGETVVLDVLADLHRMAAVLGGEFIVRLPRPPADDYCI
ncbi:MAG: hypothetical protein Q7R40_10415 [Phaeospirillum sp.]|nr:hypothetical protein [Phaeospirillum sp.]